MAPPADRTWTGAVSHPEGLFVLQGAKMAVAETDGSTTMDMHCLNVYAIVDRTDRDQLFFCIELVQHAGTTHEHMWMKAEAYLEKHRGLWAMYDMEPNRDFDVDGGIRSAGGAHLSGSNKLVDRDGTLHLDFIKQNCP